MEKEHEHEYKEVVYKIQEAVTTRADYRNVLVATLNHERVKIFCITCGDEKDLNTP